MAGRAEPRMLTEEDKAKLMREGAASLGLGNVTRCPQPPPELLVTSPLTFNAHQRVLAFSGSDGTLQAVLSIYPEHT